MAVAYLDGMAEPGILVHLKIAKRLRQGTNVAKVGAVRGDLKKHA